jgi:hypothetical protein
MSSTLKSARLLVLATTTLATPTVATARSAGPQIALHSKRPISFYRESLRTQLQVDAGFYATGAASARSDSGELGYALIGCLFLLVCAGAIAASRLEGNGSRTRRLWAAIRCRARTPASLRRGGHMDCYDLETRRLLCAERIERLARDAGPKGESKRRYRVRLSSLYELLRPATYRRRHQPIGRIRTDG